MTNVLYWRKKEVYCVKMKKMFLLIILPIIGALYLSGCEWHSPVKDDASSTIDISITIPTDLPSYPPPEIHIDINGKRYN